VKPQGRDEPRDQTSLDNAWIEVDPQPRTLRAGRPFRTLAAGKTEHSSEVTELMDSQATRRPPTQPNLPGSHTTNDGEPDHVLWIYLGAESVFFYPPGSVQEHLVVDHGIPSVDMHWKVKGYYSHEGDHHKQQGVRSGAVGDLLAVTHGHKQAA
jgi:hypothetical protein